MAGNRRKHRAAPKPLEVQGPRSEINVTPLVDVCLVLLIIFMVIMPLLARGKEVPVPRTQHHSTESDKNQPIIAVDEKGQIYFDKEPLAKVVPGPQSPTGGRTWRIDDAPALQRRVEDAFARMDEAGVVTDDGMPIPRKVFVKGTKDLPYGQVYAVLMAVKDMGMSTIDLGTNELKGAAAEAAPQ